MDALQWIAESITETAARIVVLCVAMIATGVATWKRLESALRPRRRRC